MDRIDAMKVFVAALDEGSLAGASRRLRRSPTAVSRALAFLEAHVGVELLHRTTRSLKLSEAGERYAAACRRVLIELEEADMLAAGERSAPRGILTISAPPISGEEVLRPIVDDFLDLHPAVSVRLLLLDRPVNLVDEGVDIALRVAHLPDSSLITVRLGGDVRRVVVASPRYLADHPRIREPADLAKQQIVAFTNFGLDSWSFTPAKGSSIPRTVQFAPRLWSLARARAGDDGQVSADQFFDIQHDRHGGGRTCQQRADDGAADLAGLFARKHRGEPGVFGQIDGRARARRNPWVDEGAERLIVVAHDGDV